MQLFNPATVTSRLVARAIMDSGSQRTYVTARLWDKLNLPRRGTESLRIKMFGATETQDVSCEIVELGIIAEGDETLKLEALVLWPLPYANY